MQQLIVYLLVQKVAYRKVLEDDGKGKQKVEVEQVAAWKILMFKGSFATRLFVSQDKRRGTVRLPCCYAHSDLCCKKTLLKILTTFGEARTESWEFAETNQHEPCHRCDWMKSNNMMYERDDYSWNSKRQRHHSIRICFKTDKEACFAGGLPVGAPGTDEGLCGVVASATFHTTSIFRGITHASAEQQPMAQPHQHFQQLYALLLLHTQATTLLHMHAIPVCSRV